MPNSKSKERVQEVAIVLIVFAAMALISLRAFTKPIVEQSELSKQWATLEPFPPSNIPVWCPGKVVIMRDSNGEFVGAKCAEPKQEKHRSGK